MEQLLTTKLYIPQPRPELVRRPRLLQRLNEAPHRKLTLISAPAGFGKTTLVSEWVDSLRRKNTEENENAYRTAWFSLDKDDNDPVRFLAYLITALRQIGGEESTVGEGALSMLQSPQSPPVENVLVAFINDIAEIPERVILVLDDYHVIESTRIDDAVLFLIEHLPTQLHLVIATREDPRLPLARMRGRDHLTELRAADLRFTSAEAAEFLNRVMNLNLSAESIAVLESRTEGWIAGLQLAAISMQGHENTTSRIQSFTGSHRFILDYLIEEVLQQQSDDVQSFLLQTAILDRLTGSLCDALTGQNNGQQTLEYFERTNLFLVRLDDKRQWYRYHHLFAELLRQRLYQLKEISGNDSRWNPEQLHQSASIWYENNSLELEAFHHATAANDIERAVRLIEGGGMPLVFRGALRPVLNWLKTLPNETLDSYPLLWATYASATLAIGQFPGVEQKLQAAEKALEGVELDETAKDTIGRIAATRATLAWGIKDAKNILIQSNRALEYLHPDNLPFRTATIWKLGFAHELQGDYTAAIRDYNEAIAISRATGNTFINIIASTDLGALQERENQLRLAAETYRRILDLVGDRPLSVSVGAYLGLASILYEWNDLDSAEQYGQQAIQLARHIDTNDVFAVCGVLLARLKLAQGNLSDATALLAESEQFVRRHNFSHTVPEIIAYQVITLLRQGNLTAASKLVKQHDLPVSQARIYVAEGNTASAKALLESHFQQAEAKGWASQQLRIMILQAITLQAHGDIDSAIQLLSQVLALTEPEGFIRLFVDEGPQMARLLHITTQRGISSNYICQLLAAFPVQQSNMSVSSKTSVANSELIEPLTEREMEVLQLIAEGLTNREIATKLFLSPNTVKVHARNVNGKLDVHNRTQAVARARTLGLLSPI